MSRLTENSRLLPRHTLTGLGWRDLDKMPYIPGINFEVFGTFYHANFSLLEFYAISIQLLVIEYTIKESKNSLFMQLHLLALISQAIQLLVVHTFKFRHVTSY
jgi:hypothetical protein